MAFRRSAQASTTLNEEVFPWLNDFDPANSLDVLLGTVDRERLEKTAADEKLDLSLFDGIMESITTPHIRTLLTEYKYKGFDLTSIKISFMKKVALLYPEYKSADSNARDRAISKARQDVAKIVAFCINRSMNIDKLDSLGSVKSDFVDIIKKYSLKSHLDLAEKDEGLSPQRICMLSGQLYHKMFLLSTSVYRFGKIENLDALFHNSLAPAYIPRNAWGMTQMKLWTSWCIKFSSQINSGKSEAEKMNLLKTTGNIAKVQFEQGFSEAERLLYLLSFHEKLANSDNTKYLILQSEFVMSGLVLCVDDLTAMIPAEAATFERMGKVIMRMFDQLKAQQTPVGPLPAAPVVPAARGGARGGNGGGKGGNGGN